MHNSTISLFCWLFSLHSSPRSSHHQYRDRITEFLASEYHQKIVGRVMCSREIRETLWLSQRLSLTSILDWHHMGSFIMWCIRLPTRSEVSGFPHLTRFMSPHNCQATIRYCQDLLTFDLINTRSRLFGAHRSTFKFWIGGLGVPAITYSFVWKLICIRLNAGL